MDKNYLGKRPNNYPRINQLINTIIKYNELQKNKYNKVFINPSLVVRLSGANRETVKRYFAEHKALIDGHNQGHQLTAKINHRGSGFNIKREIHWEINYV